MFLLYVTDKWHSKDSKSLLSVCSDKDKVHDRADEYCIENKVFYSTDDLLNIEFNNQTQGLKADFELMVEEVEINKTIN